MGVQPHSVHFQVIEPCCSSDSDWPNPTKVLHRMIKFITYGDYIYAPILASFFWLAMILGLLLWWAVEDNSREYRPSDASILFISDVGAEHQWLFITGSALTVFFYWMTMLFERWLRHVDRIPGTIRSRERILDILAIIFAFIGGAGLIICSCFKNTEDPTIHWTCAAIFILAVAISCIFQTWEYFALNEDHPDRRHLRRNGLMKLAIVIVAILVAIAFAALYGVCTGDADTSRCNRITSAAAVCEWAIAFILWFYFLTFILDLWPAAKTSPRYLRRIEKKQGLHEKGLIAPANADEQRSDYYASHPDYYQQNPSPVHESNGIAMSQPVNNGVLSTPQYPTSSYVVNDPAAGRYEEEVRR